MKSNPLSILFGGQEAKAELVDGTTVKVFVRALPLRHLHHVIENCEWPNLLVELCCLLKAPKPTGKPVDGRWPDIAPPDGYQPVPAGWTDNLKHESVMQLYEQAKQLNFQPAVDWAKGQIAARKMVAPLLEQTMQQLSPVIEQVLKPLMGKLDNLSTSALSAPPSSASPEKKS